MSYITFTSFILTRAIFLLLLGQSQYT